MENRLVTERVENLLKEFPLYSQDGMQMNAICSCMFSIGHIRWYILEGQKEGSDFTFYGIVVGMYETEYGYVSANELANININSPIGNRPMIVEPERDFKPCQLKNIQDVELQRFLGSMYA